MSKIYELGMQYKRDELVHLKENYLLDLKSKEAENPDAKIPFISLKNIFLRPNIDEGTNFLRQINCEIYLIDTILKLKEIHTTM